MFFHPLSLCEKFFIILLVVTQRGLGELLLYLRNTFFLPEIFPRQMLYPKINLE